MEEEGGIEPATFQGVCVGKIPLVEDLIQDNIYLTTLILSIDHLLVNFHEETFKTIATLPVY